MHEMRNMSSINMLISTAWTRIASLMSVNAKLAHDAA
jgi:hypothetical protein